MPIYEYKCKSCEKTFEALRRMSQGDTPAPCPTCGGEETMRLLSLIAAPAKNGGPDLSHCRMPEVCGPGGG